MNDALTKSIVDYTKELFKETFQNEKSEDYHDAFHEFHYFIVDYDNNCLYFTEDFQFLILFYMGLKTAYEREETKLIGLDKFIAWQEIVNLEKKIDETETYFDPDEKREKWEEIQSYIKALKVAKRK